MTRVRELLVATRSTHKLRELVSLDEAGVPENPIEEHLEVYETFEANARAKAAFFQRSTLMRTIADDSGLWVDHLDGGPGVRTKRFAPVELVERYGRDEANNRYLLERLDGVPENDRGARYRCAIAYDDGETSFVVEGSVEGSIATEPSRKGGFGYDPLFIVPEYGQTFGVLPAEVKAELSHRARAARQLAARLRDSGDTS